MIGRCLTFISPVTLSLKDRQLVVVFKDRPDEKHTAPIEDLGVVIIDNPQISVTVPLLNALAENNVAVVFCNDKGVPSSVLWNMDTNHNQCAILNAQIGLDGRVKRKLWRQTIVAKITNQANLLHKLGKNADKLKPYYTFSNDKEIENKEGIAARLYFQELFGDSFIRDRSQPGLNAMLNYGYTIVRTACIKSLLGSGLFPALGLFHHHRANAFPLADDIMEPYRPFVDEIVFDLYANGVTGLDRTTKQQLASVLYCDTVFEKVKRPLSIGLNMTASSVAECVLGNRTEINYPVLNCHT